MVQWTELVGDSDPIETMDDLFNRYEREVIPKKAPRTAKDNLRQIGTLRKVFGRLRPTSIKPRHIYQFLDVRSQQALTAANREYELLSHTLTKAVQWGVIDENPCRHVRRDDYRPKPRQRYVTDQEYQAAYDLASDRVQIAMDLAILTGAPARRHFGAHTRQHYGRGSLGADRKNGQGNNSRMVPRTPKRSIEGQTAKASNSTSVIVYATRKTLFSLWF